MSSPLVKVIQAKKEYEGGRVIALDGVDLEVQPGEFVAIHGIPGVRYHSKRENVPFFSDLPLIGTSIYKTRRIPDRLERIILVYADWGDGESSEKIATNR